MAAGYKIDSLQESVVEVKIKYDDHKDPDPVCGIGDTFNANKTCDLSFTVPKDMLPPILVYYELDNFHQNHRSYYQSRDDYQLNGRVGNQDKVSRLRCEPLNKLGNMTLNPCGLTANTFFNDYYDLIQGNDAQGNPLVMNEHGIAWQSDLRYAFKQPEGFRSEECPAQFGCSDACCADENWSCRAPYIDPKDPQQKCYRYHYPQDDTTQYLYETYPDIISPLEGVTNEHFVVWMRVATQPRFQKLYGWINQPIRAGEQLVFRVHANFVVSRFRGYKALMLTTNNIFGGRNPYLGTAFYVVGYICLGAGLFFTLKHVFRRRRLADPAYLHYKSD